ncbi:MAG: hypothetical protein SFV15_08690 [Polyangiaceae bacterium]|nr:hypothetical protein [Polyangiaceae bacterium]
MATDFDTQMKAKIQTFTEELTDLVREAAMATLREALGEPKPRRGRTRAQATPFVLPPLPISSGRVGGGTRPKRSADELENMSAQLLSYVTANPGQRIEAIAAGMNVSTKELNLPAKRLLAKKQLKTRGHKRATEYFAK